MSDEKKISSAIGVAVRDVIEERKEEGGEKKPDVVVGVDDTFVSLGDLSGTTLDQINTGGKNYETITLDYIATFNHAVTQGVNPVKALLAMVQACAITMGQCIRAGMKEDAAFGMVAFIVGTAKKAKSKVKIVTTIN